METYANVLLYGMPIFMGLVLLEKLYGFIRFKHEFNSLDTISSLSSGLTNSLKDVLQLSVSIITYKWMVEHWAIFTVKNNILTYLIAFVSLDFAGYWVHRMSHQINFFWNKHAIHHSSEEFNLACALRQSISSFVSLFTIFLIPSAILGVPNSVIQVIAPLHLFAQFWYHTIYINRMGLLEAIIVTPSHHRVHHAINAEYLDKNHGQIFIIWDKLFGTFQAELPTVKPIYGITRPVSTWNPIKINFQHLFLLISDAYKSNIKDKLRIWFMPTGWRPEGFEVKYPVHKITDPYTYSKYKTDFPKNVYVWFWLQFSFTLGFVSVLYFYFSFFDFNHLLFVGLLVFLNVYAYSELMDKSTNYIYFEVFKNLYGLTLIFATETFTKLFYAQPVLKPLFISYFLVSCLVCGLLTNHKYKLGFNQK